MRFYTLFFVFALFFGGAQLCAAEVGSIKSSKGQAWIVRGQERIEVASGTRLLLDDVLKTGSRGALGLILRDDTIISMGPNSEMALAEYVFQPDEHSFRMLVKFFKGTFSYLSGMITKLAPESVIIETPVGMVAVRGTHCLINVQK